MESIHDVVFVSHSSALGGAELSLLDLVAEIRGSLHVEAVLPSQGELYVALRELGVPCTVCRGLGYLHRHGPIGLRIKEMLGAARASVNILNRTRARRPRVLHANSTTAALFGLMAAKRCHTSLVWHVRDLSGLGAWAPWLGKACSRVIPVSRCVEDAIRPLVDHQKIRRIPNGIHIEGLRSSGGRRRQVRSGQKTASVVAIGQLVPWKGHKLFIRAAARIFAEAPQARFRIVGAEPEAASGAGYTDELVAEISRLGLDAAVTLTGRVRDVARILDDADLLIHTAFPEPFGRVVVEAMAAGVPVIALDGGHGPAEILRSGIDGRLVTPHTSEALAQAAIELIHSPETRRRMGAEAAHRAGELFSRGLMARRVEAVYASILSESSRVSSE